MKAVKHSALYKGVTIVHISKSTFKVGMKHFTSLPAATAFIDKL